MTTPWLQALDAVDAGARAVLVVVVDAAGSVPGTPGAKMLVSESGLFGTVGGGVAEHRLAEHARAVADAPELVSFDHDGGDDGSICSGRQTFALLPLGSTQRDALSEIVATLKDRRAGALRLSQQGLAFTAGDHLPRAFERGTDAWSYTETLGDLDTLVIVGGGHVALALSRVMATLPFRIVVLDDRPDLPTMTANVWADEKRVIAYEDVAEHVPDGDRTWVAIMTQGHLHDKDVLVRLVEKPLRYLGMLGSGSKVREMWSRLERGGVEREHLERVHSPIGLRISSHSPEEIAISIAAEIVKVRNG
jgi:xanthine dehydrogenase accessory factor